jgi:hypothetical protein
MYVINYLHHKNIMATKKIKDLNKRKLTKMGRKSLGLTLPKDIVKKLKWKEGQNVMVKQQGRLVVIKDAKSR